MRFAKVIVGISLDKSFDYLIPKELENEIRTGTQVYVPFGKSRRRGCVIGLKNESSYPAEKLKKIESVCDTHPQIPDSLLRLGKWISEYYCCSQEQAMKALLPAAVRSGKIKHKSLKIYYPVSPEEAQKYIFEKEKKYPARAKVVRLLLQRPGISSEVIKKDAQASDAVLRSLIKEKLIFGEKKEIYRDPFCGAEFAKGTVPSLTCEQENAVMFVRKMLDGGGGTHTLLLHGVTGSGKTEVYLRSISLALERGKDSIVLVPEISLTPQTIERFRSRFGNMVSVLHSALSDGERFDEWTKIYREQVKIVVGARSALFAPFKNPGLIIVDEEHENSYKQEEAPRYHARDVAVLRGSLEKAVVILGSATPSFESYYNAVSGKYAIARLENRVDNCVMPKMRVVDMRIEALSNEGRVFSEELVSRISDRLEKGEQTIIFLNRRGFATQMICLKCGFVAGCSECSIAYTYHKKREILSCHICGALIPAHKFCPKCGFPDIRYSGLGTEKIETIASTLFPHARIARMDSDTMTRKNSYEKILREFRSGRIDILIGTQMIAKGLHFPNVTLVGIIYADLSLHIPDFRSSERTFQLLTQVAGRAGRGDVPGEVIIQTYTPAHSAVLCAVNHDFEKFYDDEIRIRKDMKYPPFGHLTAVHFRGTDENTVAKFADEFLGKIRPSLNQGIKTGGPVPCRISKAKGKFRYFLLFRGGPMKEFRKSLRELVLHSKRPKGVEVYADVDAVNLM